MHNLSVKPWKLFSMQQCPDHGSLFSVGMVTFVRSNVARSRSNMYPHSSDASTHVTITTQWPNMQINSLVYLYNHDDKCPWLTSNPMTFPGICRDLWPGDIIYTDMPSRLMSHIGWTNTGHKPGYIYNYDNYISRLICSCIVTFLQKILTTEQRQLGFSCFPENTVA